MTSVFIKGKRGTFRQAQRLCNRGGRDWNGAATSQGIPEIAGRHQKRQGSFFPRTLRGAWSC